MKYFISVIIIAVLGVTLRGQTVTEPIEGTVSYITTQNVYVKFKSTENLTIGDTLFLKQGETLVPVLIVNNLSSISCVCTTLSSTVLKVADVIIAKSKMPLQSVPKAEDTVNELKPQPLVVKNDSLPDEALPTKKIQQDIGGRLSVSSYSNFSNSEGDNSQRMRYTFSLKANNIGDSRLSAETYLSFVHSNKNWDDVQQNVFNGLKIYSLGLRYDFNKSMSVIFGRKINSRISSIGAIDGIQFEKSFGAITVGAFAGSRPDYRDYSYNFGLLQYGVYLGHDFTRADGKGNMQSSLAYIEQTNSGNTDRRFAYFQHYNSLIKKLYFFGSVEMDLYKKVNDKAETTFNLSNLYLMLRYQVIKQLSLSVSYSARQNIIYYETYKDYIERLLESETLQGYRFMATLRPVKNLSFGAKAGYRYRVNDPKPTRDLYGYLTYSRVPWLNVSTTLSATIMESNYLKGNIYSVGINRDLIPGKVSGGFNYRYVDYRYYSTEFPQIQNIGEINIYWRIYKKLSLSVYYEGTFEKQVTFNRIYANLSYRF